MVTEVEPKELGVVWEKVNSILEALGYSFGPPLGFDRFNITTDQPELAGLIKDVNPEPNFVLDGEFVSANGENVKIHRSWYTSRPWKGKYGKVVVLKREHLDRTATYKILFLAVGPANQRLEITLETLSALKSGTLAEAEIKAQERLFSSLSEHQIDLYIIGGGFIEIGKSGVVYVLRKNRPTLALRVDEDQTHFTPLCALCLHPVGYYTGTWAGILPPSDEVLAHLLMIRASEHFFWKKANQIPLDEWTSGI